LVDKTHDCHKQWRWLALRRKNERGDLNQLQTRNLRLLFLNRNATREGIVMIRIPELTRVSKFGAALFSAALLLGAGATAHALSITYSDVTGCGGSTCFGCGYTLESTSLGSNQYQFDLSVNTAGFTSLVATGLDGVAIKVVANANDIVINSFSSSAASFSSAGELGLNANGCGGGGGGFLCASSSNTGGVSVPDGTYTFQWLTTISNGKFFTNVNDWSLKALYVNSDGAGRGLTSASGGVPVPGTLLVFGLGFALFIGWQYYRSRHRSGPVGVAA